MRVRVTDIQWDLESDGEQQSVTLPSTMAVEIEGTAEDPVEVLHERALDAVSNATGWCVLSSRIELETSAALPA